jgi:hypothetical protein
MRRQVRTATKNMSQIDPVDRATGRQRLSSKYPGHSAETGVSGRGSGQSAAEIRGPSARARRPVSRARLGGGARRTQTSDNNRC